MRLGIDREGEIICAIQNVQVAWNDFYVSGRKLWIFGAWHARRDSTTDLNHIFATQCMRLLCKLGVFFRAKDNLRQTFAIAQIDENDAAVIARDVHPTGKRDLPADVGFAKRTAIVRAVHALLTLSEWEIRASVYVWEAQAASLSRSAACRSLPYGLEHLAEWPGSFSARLPKRTG
jgi:hypothetical protein